MEPTSPNRGEAISLKARPRSALKSQVCKRGTFAVPTGTVGLKLGRYTEDAVKRFGAMLIKSGWTILQAPTIRRINVSDDPKYEAKYNKDGTMALLVPTNRAMRTDDPWYKPESDQYEIAFICTRRPRQVTYDLSQEYLDRFGLPPGMTLKE